MTHHNRGVDVEDQPGRSTPVVAGGTDSPAASARCAEATSRADAPRRCDRGELLISEMVREGIPLGSLWYSNHFDERSS